MYDFWNKDWVGFFFLGNEGLLKFEYGFGRG
jgi:hypothetical protein